MGNTWTTSDLISDILLLGHVPTGNNTFTPQNILRLATLEIQTPIAKQILSTRGGYYLDYLDYAAVANGLYGIPSAAVAGALANVELIQGPTIVPVNIVEESEQFSTNASTSTSYGCFLKGNFVQIIPIPNVGTPRLWFLKRTSDLILTTAASQVTGIAGAVISVSSIPSTIVVGSILDACGDQPPFNILGTQIVLGISGTDITLDAPVTGLTIGDWLAPTGQTPIPQIPVEYRLILAQRVVCKIYELQGYLDKLAAAQKKLAEYESDTFNLITPRIKSQTKIVNPINGGFLSGYGNRMFNYPAGKNS